MQARARVYHESRIRFLTSLLLILFSASSAVCNESAGYDAALASCQDWEAVERFALWWAGFIRCLQAVSSFLISMQCSMQWVART